MFQLSASPVPQISSRSIQPVRRAGAIRRLVFLILAIAFCLRPAPGQTSAQREGLRENRPDVWALTGARIVVAPGRVVEEGTIVVRHGRIESVGKDAPPDAQFIDLAGRTIYPGLIDCFSETEGPDDAPAGAPYWNDKITPQESVADYYSADDSLDKKYRSQGIVARLVAPQGGVIKGVSAVVHTNDQPARHALLGTGGLHVRLTVTRRRGSGRSGYPNSPMGAFTLARQAFYDAGWYKNAWKALRTDRSTALPENNDALQTMQPYLQGKSPVIIDSSNELYALRADRFGREFGLNVVIHGSGNEYRRLTDIAATGRTVIVPVNFPRPPNVATAESALGVSLESMLHWDLAPENPGRLEKAGVPIVLTSHGLKDPSKFLGSVRKAVHRGLSADAALRAMTTRPAALLSLDKLLGTIEAGKLADFVVTDGDLFADKTKVVETWINGRRFRSEKSPQREIAGTWRMRIAAAGKRPKALTFSFSGGSTDRRGSVHTGDKKDSVKLSRLGLRDVQLSGTFPGDSFGADGIARFSVQLDSDGQSGMGQIIWPDESRSRVQLSRDEDSAESAEDPPKKKVDKRPRAASFAVNYPLGAYGRTEQPEQSTVVFQNATVWTCGEAGLLTEASILVEGGRIKAVGKELSVPQGAVVIDAQGRHITPGIIDCHSHMATDGGVNESGQAVTAEVRIGDFIDCDDMTIYRQLAGGVTSSNILHGSANPIGGQNQVIKLRWGMNPESMKFSQAPQGIKFALGENVKQSNRRSSSTRYPQTRMGVEQLFRDEFQAAIEYRNRWNDWKKNRTGMPPRFDLELEAVAEIVEGKRWIHCHSYRQDEILALIRVLDEQNIRIGTFQHILEGYKVADAMARHGAMGSAFADWWAYKFEVYDAIPFAGALMHNAGVVVSFNSDDAELGTHLNQEAAKAVKYGGVEPHEALKFVTLNPAKQLRIDQHVGSIEPGKHADLVVWSGPPLSNFSRAEQTWVDGRKYFDREEDAAWRKRSAHMRAVLIQKILVSQEPMREPGVGDGDPAALWPREDLFCRHGHHHDDDHHDHSDD